jgi:hypothetical protein
MIVDILRMLVIGRWIKLNKKEHRNVYSSKIAISVIKQNGMKWALSVGDVGEIRNANRNVFGKPEERGQFEILGVDGKT